MVADQRVNLEPATEKLELQPVEMEVPLENLEQATAVRATETRPATTHVRMEEATTTAKLEAAVTEMEQVTGRMEVATAVRMEVVTAGRMEPTIERVMEEPPESRRLLAETKTSTSHPQADLVLVLEAAWPCASQRPAHLYPSRRPMRCVLPSAKRDAEKKFLMIKNSMNTMVIYFDINTFKLFYSPM